MQQFIVFCEKIYSCNSQPPQYQKKINKDNFRKNYNNPQCFLKNYKTKFSISLILKK